MVALALRIDAPSAPSKAAYQGQDSPLTLTEGLEEYYRINAAVVSRPDTLAPQSQWLFRSHDMCHVIFGLGTSLADETMADTRTLLSCDVGWAKYSRYLTSDPQAKAIFRALGWPRIVAITLRTVPRIVRAVFEAFRMKQRWPWIPPESFQTRTLADLRREFGIRVI